MSFVVTFQGQFKPYTLPDLRGHGKVKAANAANSAKSLKGHEDDDFENILAGEQGKRDPNKKPGHSAYQAHQKRAEKESINKSMSKSLDGIFAKDIMSSPVHYLYQEDTLEKALASVDRLGHRHFPILNSEDVLCGIVSDRDMLLAKELPKKTKIKDFMANETLTALDHANVQDLARIMLYEKISCLPVINDKRQVVGIVTASDILNLVVQSAHLDLSI